MTHRNTIRRPGQTAPLGPVEARRAIRAGRHTGTTAGMAPGFLQGNLVILPGALADDFKRFCLANPRPCPLIGITAPGSPYVPELGADLDLTTDLPAYKLFRNGNFREQLHDISHLWRDDLVGFVLGCSFSFEAALLKAGIPVRHIEQGTTVPMYATSIATAPAGQFFGSLVVSMRPLSEADAERAAEISARFPEAHGAPVHVGDPAAIGIENIEEPAFGAASAIRAGEVPVFWACGVTPQLAIVNARPKLAITHAPGAMIITDVPANHAKLITA